MKALRHFLPRPLNLAALLLGFAAASRAQAAAEISEVVSLDTFEIFADRAPAADNSAIEQRRLTLPEPFTGVTREEFGRRANRRAGDIVARLSGMFMGGPPGENKDARGRGLDKEYTRAQVDGLALPDGGEKRELQLNRIPADLVQEVRVLRNPSPEFESDGFAARLDFRFRPAPEQRFFAETRLAAGGRNRTGATRQLGSMLLGGRPLPSLGWLASFNYLDDPTYKVKAEEEFAPATGVLRKSVPERETKPTRARDLYLDASWRYAAGEFHLKPLRLDLREPKTKTKTTFDFTKPASADETTDLERENKGKLGEGLSLTHRHTFGLGGHSAEVDSRLSWQRVTERHLEAKTTDSFKETAGRLVLDKRTTETEDKADATRAFDTKLSLPLARGAHLVKAGLALRLRDRNRDKVKLETKGAVTTDTTGPKDNYAIAENYYAVFAQDSWRATDRFTLLAGARSELVDFASRTPASADAAHTFRDFNPNAQLNYRLRGDTALTFAVSRAVNRPKFDELSPYEQNDGKKVTLGNPDLRPARAWKADLGLVHRRASFFVAANLFAHDVTGLIESIQTGELRSSLPVTQVRNVGDGRVHGLELEQRVGFAWTRLRPLAGLTLWANQTWIRSEVREFATGLARRFSGQPDFLGHLGADYELGRIYLTASLQHIGARPGDEASADLKQQRAENTVDAAIHFRLGRGLSLFVEGNNLTDAFKNERTLKADGTRVSKIERTGRAWFAGVRHAF